MSYKDAIYLSALNDPRFMGLSDNGQCLEYWTEPNAQTGVAGRINVCANTENEWKALFDGRFGKARTNPARDIKRSDEVTKTVLLSQGVSEDQLDHELAMNKLEHGLDHYLTGNSAIGGIYLQDVTFWVIATPVSLALIFVIAYLIDSIDEKLDQCSEEHLYKATCGKKELTCGDGITIAPTNSGINVFCNRSSDSTIATYSTNVLSCPAGQDISITETQ